MTHNMKIIVGLGNPGKEYEITRHNAGFMAVDFLAEQYNVSWSVDKKSKSLIAEGNGLMLIKPQNFMNRSGENVAAIMRYYKMLPSGLFGIKKDSDLTQVLTVIHDELDLNLGDYKISQNSGSAGHNGVQSIIDSLKTKNFKRLRLGISTEARKQIPGDKFVLMKFSEEELVKLKKVITETISQI